MESQEIILFETKSPTDKSTLTAKITENGTLTLEGYDIGERAKQTFGDIDYEYWYHIEPAHANQMLLQLLKENFQGNESQFSEAKFREWMLAHNIPYKFESYT